MEINTFIQNFFEQLDDTDRDQIAPDVKFKELDEWDSLTSLSIIAMVDEEYNVKLTGTDLRDSITIANLFSLVQSRFKVD